MKPAADLPDVSKLSLKSPTAPPPPPPVRLRKVVRAATDSAQIVEQSAASSNQSTTPKQTATAANSLDSAVSNTHNSLREDSARAAHVVATHSSQFQTSLTASAQLPVAALSTLPATWYVPVAPITYPQYQIPSSMAHQHAIMQPYQLPALPYSAAAPVLVPYTLPVNYSTPSPIIPMQPNPSQHTPSIQASVTSNTARPPALPVAHTDSSPAPQKPVELKTSLNPFLPVNSNQVATSSVRGLTNLGNSCYLNCILQNLAQCKPLRDSLLHEMPVLALAPLIPSMLSSKSGSTQLLSSFQKWMREMWSESARGPDASDTVIPNQLLMAIVQKFPSFSGKEQHDAVELFRSLLDGLSEEINALRKSSNGPAANVIADRFHGAFGSYVECQTCKAVTKRGEDFVDISLSLPQANVSSDYNQPIRCPFCSVSSANADALKVHVKQCSAALKFDPVHVAQSMQQTLTNTSTLNRLALASQPNPVPVADLLSCMEHFTAIEPLEDYRCDACTAAGRGTHQQARKCFLIAKPPPSLVIHIKRFAYSMDGSMRKIDSFMSFPEYLDMTRFCRHQNTRHAYALTGIAVHMGGMQGGHYVAYVKHSGQWHYCSDSRVRLCEIGEVMKQNAYVLFYSRVE